MPTLRFHDCFTSTERKILSRTFHQNCRDLGITKRDASIDVNRVFIPNPAHLGAITKINPDQYIIILNSKNDLMRSIFAIGHEMVHFDQHTRGDMVDYHDGNIIWKGKAFPRWLCDSKTHYDILPWEIEAAQKHEKLMDSAMRCLPRHEREYVCNTAIDEAA